MLIVSSYNTHWHTLTLTLIGTHGLTLTLTHAHIHTEIWTHTDILTYGHIGAGAYRLEHRGQASVLQRHMAHHASRLRGLFHLVRTLSAVAIVQYSVVYYSILSIIVVYALTHSYEYICLHTHSLMSCII